LHRHVPGDHAAVVHHEAAAPATYRVAAVAIGYRDP
jgi:hypothetical protein